MPFKTTNVVTPSICSFCSNEFLRDSPATAGAKVFCSRDCYAASRSKQIEKFCLQCGGSFKVSAYIDKRGCGKYCSTECLNANRQQSKIVAVCEHCKESFYTTMGSLNRGFSKYCSDDCRSTSLRDNLVERCCSFCGAVLRVRRCRAESYKTSFCSRDHKNLFHEAKRKGVCKGCGIEFDRKDSTRTFCTPACYYKTRRADTSQFSSPPADRVEKMCQNCQKVFFVTKYKSTIGGGKFCSNDCRQEDYKRHSVERTCTFCGVQFRVDLHKSEMTKDAFCCREHRREYQKQQHLHKVCEGCGNSYDTSSSGSKKDRAARRYCSRDCFQKHRKETSIHNAICKSCGESFLPGVDQTYCSRECFQKDAGIQAGKVTLVCKNCEKPFEVYSNRVKKGACYCSADCSSAGWAKRERLAPNKAELYLFDIITEVAPNEYRMNMAGDFILNRKIPDFVNVNGQKKIIELYGEHVHPVSDEAERKEEFLKFGFDTLIVWHRELRDRQLVLQKIKDFHESKFEHKPFVGLGG